MQKRLSRRSALKLLVASSGAVLGTALLPGKWVKPVVETGVLPVHAQASVNLTLASLQATQEYSFLNEQHLFGASFSYSDSLGEVSGSWVVNSTWTATGAMNFNGMSLTALGAIITGGGSSGTISFEYAPNNCIFGRPAHTDTANISISNGIRTSNIVSDSVTEIEVDIPNDQRNSSTPHK